jgi:hypothetical protein
VWIAVSKLDAQPASEHLDALKAEVIRRWGVVGLLDVLPRLKNIGSARLYRPGEGTSYPGLEPVLSRAINWDLITQ